MECTNDTLLEHARRLAEARDLYPVAEAQREEHAALVALLLRDRSDDDPLTEPLADTIAAACMVPEHLWSTLELPDRTMLRTLLETYFGPLARENTMDMRWKRFLYKRMCGWEGFRH